MGCAFIIKSACIWTELLHIHKKCAIRQQALDTGDTWKWYGRNETKCNSIGCFCNSKAKTLCVRYLIIITVFEWIKLIISKWLLRISVCRFIWRQEILIDFLLQQCKPIEHVRRRTYVKSTICCCMHNEHFWITLWWLTTETRLIRVWSYFKRFVFFFLSSFYSIIVLKHVSL